MGEDAFRTFKGSKSAIWYLLSRTEYLGTENVANYIISHLTKKESNVFQ